MKKVLVIQVILIMFISLSTKDVNEQKCNYVPNEETAIKVAEAILLPIYGEEILENRPFKAVLVENKFWQVEGTMGLDELGGVPIVQIQKSDCKILSVTHTK